MKQWIGPAVLCIGLTIAASASGQEVLPTPTPIIVGPAVHCYDCTQEKNGFIHRCIDKFERHGCGYGTTHQDIGTIGVRAHCVFIFGNSQQFFGEPCNKQPQHRWFRKY